MTKAARCALAMTALLAAHGRDVRAADPPSGRCGTPEHRRLDFWLGDWDAYEAADRGRPIARARIDAILDGCALHERYEQADGLVGESFTLYDAARKAWHQSWVTNRGQLLQIDGRFDGARLTLEGPQTTADGQAIRVRATWSPEGDGVRETALVSVDQGQSWKALFDVVFKRHPGTRR